MQTKRLFLVDGSALAYRAHYALSDHTLTNSRGVLTGAVFGFVNSLLGLLEQERPEAIAVVFDASGPTFRHELLEKYKAKRKAMPEELVEQMPVIRHFVRALGMTLLREQGVEADDVIGTLARRAEVSGMQTWIVSPDKDFAQLVTEQVTLLRPKHRGKGYNVMDQAGVQERFGVKPTQFIDYLALVGDTSDGFDGVKGIGEKTATALLNQFGSLDQVYAQIEEVKPAGTKKKLEEQHEGAMLSRQLATIVTDVEIDFTPEALLWSSIDSQETYRLCADLEFPSLWKRLRKWSAEDQQDVEIQAFYEPAPELEITLVKDRSGLEAAVKQAAQAERLFWHWFMPDPEHSERGILAWATTTGQICLCVPSEASQRQAVEPMQSLNLFASSAPDSVQGVSLEEVVQAFAEIFADPQKCVVGFDLKPWFLLCIAQEIPRPRAFFDVMLAAYVLKPGRRDQELSTLALEFLRRQKTEPEALLGKGRKKRKWSEIESGQRDAFVAEELDLAMRLYTCVAQEVEERGYPSLLEELEFPLLEVLAQMEARGVALDLSLLKGLESELTQRVDELSAQVAAYAPEPEFNVNSPQQVAALLFEHLKLHEQYGVKVKKTKKGGRYSTDQEVLEQLSVHPLACLILEVRELQKLLSTYITALPTQVKLDAQECARIHTSFRQAHTATGRLSSMNPNLQNIPIRTERGRAIRKAFVPGPAGWQMLSADYSQVELRLLAHVSEDPTLMEAFQQGVDIHTKTAASIFECSSQEVTPTQRSAAKAINFGIIYGMGPPRLAKEIDVSVDEAGRFIKAYFRSYPKVREYLDRTIEEAKRQGYVETLLGRRRWIQDIHSSNAKLRAAAYNIAVNTPIQGSAADLIKRAMLAIDRRLQEAQMQAKMLLQIHDELLFEVPPEETEPLQVLLRQEMEGAMQLKVPLVVEVGCGQHWADAH